MSFKILRAALEGPESEMDVIFKSKHRESTMSRDDMVKIKSELSDSVDCTICKTRISIDTATDIYTKVSNCSHRLFSSLISRITNIVFHQDDFSKFMCKHCFCLLLKIDETEQAYLRLKREFHDMCIRAIGDGTSNYPELYKTVSTQTDDGTRSHNMYSEFCSVEEKDNEATAQLNPPSPAPSIPMNDTYYDSDSEPLSKKKPKKDRKTKKSRKIKQKSRTVSNYTCHECGKTFGTKLTLTEHTLYDHIVEDVKDIQVDFNLKEDIGKRKASKRKVESDVEILLNHIKEENTTDAISNDENNLDDDDKDDVPIMPILDEETSTSSAGIILRKRRSKARLKQEYLEGEYFDDDMTDSNYEYIKPREGPARRNHLPRNRLPKQVFQCPECPETFKSKARMQYHADKHGVGKPPYICEVCGASYKNKKACDIHVGMHKGISPWKCDLCSKLFPSKGALQRHEAIHTGKTNYQCDLCGKSFIHTSSFKMHKLSHSGVKPHACQVCGLSLMTKSHLKRHARAHSGEKRHECQTCGKKFSERYNLHAHQKSHNNGVLDKTRPKFFRCTVCDNGFERRYLLEKHMEVAHQRVMEKGPKKPRMTMSRLLKMQAAGVVNPTATSTATTAISPTIPSAPPITPAAVKIVEVEVKPLAEVVQVSQETFKTSPRDSPVASDEPQTSNRANTPTFSLAPPSEGNGPPGGGPWPGQPGYHQLANDFPLRMHGLDYASYIGRQ